jgi:hypothetical protein
MTGEPADWRITSSKGTLAMLYDGDTVGPRYERDANARLIAASPEMYAALKLVWDSREEHPGERIKVLNEVARVLTKAEGKS